MSENDNWLSWVKDQDKQMEQFYDSEDYEEPEEENAYQKSNDSEEKDRQKPSNEPRSSLKLKTEQPPLLELGATSAVMLIDKLGIQKGEVRSSPFIGRPKSKKGEEQPQVLKQFQTFKLFQTSQEKTLTVIHHLIKKSIDKKLADRLAQMVQQMRNRYVQLNELLTEIDAHDLNLINQHRLVLSSLEETLKQLFCINQYDFYNKINFKELLLNTYSHLTHTVNFQRLENGMKIQILTMYGQQFDNNALRRLVEVFFSNFKSYFEHKREQLKQVHKKNMRFLKMTENQKKQENDRNLGVWDRGDDRNDIGQSRNYDEISKFEFFNNREQEYELFEDQDIYKYRLHRTITFLQKYNILDGSEPLEKAIDYACFIIKFTDQHMQKVLKKTIANAKLSAKSKVSNQYEGICDEMTYFSSKFGPFKEIKSEKESKVIRYGYPSILNKYHELRYIQMVKENKLHQLLYPELYPTLSRTHTQTHPHQKAINDYYYFSEVRKQILDQHRYYQQPAKVTNDTIKVQVPHLIHALEQHPFYRKKQTIYRMRAVY